MYHITSYTKQRAKEMGVDRTAIGNCCKGKSKTSCGFIWKYKDSEIYVINQYIE